MTASGLFAQVDGHPLTATLTTWDHTVSYQGAPILGTWGSEVAKRIDIVATALSQDLRVDQLNDLDLSYAPPLSSPWDPIQMVVQAWLAV